MLLNEIKLDGHRYTLLLFGQWLIKIEIHIRVVLISFIFLNQRSSNALILGCESDLIFTNNAKGVYPLHQQDYLHEPK